MLAAGRKRILGGLLIAAALALPAGIKAADTYEEYIEEAWTTDGQYTSPTYYHRSELEGTQLLNGIDVSWWQGDGKGSSVSHLNWEQVHEAGIDFAFVRVGSRDTADGSIYEDTCADAHIQGALENDINVGLYIFSQALNEEEAEEEAEFVLELLDDYGWDVTMPIVMDREAGSYKRLTAGKLSKTKETNICCAFSSVISGAGYTPMVYASANWVVNYINTDRLAESGCKLWLARYNNSTDMPTGSLTYTKLSGYEYEFWQYSSAGKVDGYSKDLDVDFWYLNTDVKTKNLQMTANAADSVSLKWSKAGDAQKYRLYRYDSEQDKYVSVKSTAGKSYTDAGLAAGETYQYKVRCYWTVGGTNYYGKYSDVLTAVTLPGRVKELGAEDQTASTITLSWNKLHGADGYRVYSYNEDEDKFVKLADVTDGSLSYEVAGLSGAKEYQFKVKGFRKFEGTTYWGTNSEACAAVTKPSEAKELAADTASASAIDLSWNKVSRATGYQIYRLNADTGKYEKLATVKGNKTFDYTDSGLKSATECSYKVRAYLSYGGSNYYGAFSAVESAKTKPAKVKNLKLSTKSGTITLKWDKVPRVSGYQIYRLNTKTGKYEKVAAVKGNSTFSYKDTGLKKGTSYTYKVRAYVSYNGNNYYGSFSDAVKLKAK
ncbi:MAG: fibronectin type III domain-containing protein [Blautia sp.]|nr:fibronectin type III domain-containing protein [Blautia sp.]